MKSIHRHIIEQVPADYYQKGVKENLLQKIWHTNKLNMVLKSIEYEKKEKILDVGCASGWFIFEISKKYPKSYCFGIDIYEKGIDYAKKKYSHIKFKTADAHKIPYEKEVFDIVICTEVLEHVDDPKLVLTEIKRVLKKGGIAVIELDSGSWLFSFAWYIWRKFLKGKVWNEAHLHSFNVNKLDKLITSCDFKILSKRRFLFGMAMIFKILK